MFFSQSFQFLRRSFFKKFNAPVRPDFQSMVITPNTSKSNFNIDVIGASLVGNHGQHVNEDRMFCVSNLMDGKYHFIGVLDGHGDHFVSDFASKFLGTSLEERLKTLDEKSALIETFLDADKFLLNPNSVNKLGFSSQDTEKAVNAGCCVTAVLINTTNLTALVANLGDCRLYTVSTSGISQLITDDHDHASLNELNRIVPLGGFFSDGYLFGRLQPTRVLGDFHVKMLGLLANGKNFNGKTYADAVKMLEETPAIEQVPSPSPEIHSIDLKELMNEGNDLSSQTKNPAMLILGSDGLWGTHCDKELKSVATNTEEEVNIGDDLRESNKFIMTKTVNGLISSLVKECTSVEWVPSKLKDVLGSYVNSVHDDIENYDDSTMVTIVLNSPRNREENITSIPG